MVAGAIGIALLLQPVLKLLLELFPKYQYYISGVYMDGQARVAIILKIIILGLMLIVPLWVSGIGNRSTKIPVIWRFIECLLRILCYW